MLVAAGDIASCDVETDAAVGVLIEEEEDATVAVLGDLVYPSGTPEYYRDCYHPAWGPFLDRSRPAVGNHDLEADGGAAYWEYVGDRGGDPGKGWYSYDLGAWHVVVLNSNCELIDCRPGSEQHGWLVSDLEATEARCTLAYFHQPHVGSGIHGRNPPVDPLWATLQEKGVDLVLTGHEHHYERFRPLAADGSPDAEGVPLIIVGTGGAGLRQSMEPMLGSEVIIDDAFGYLRLALSRDRYEWAFVPLGGEVSDEGTGMCRASATAALTGKAPGHSIGW